MNEAGNESSTKKSAPLKYIILITGLVLSIAAMAATFVWVGHQDQANKNHLALATEQRLLSRSIVTQSFEASRGNEEAFTQLRQIKNRFDEILRIEKEGDPQTGLPASSGGATPLIEALETQWQQIRSAVDTLLAGRDSVLAISSFAPLLEGLTPKLLALSDDIANRIISSGANSKQVYIATQQLLLIQRIESSLNRLLVGDQGAETAFENFSRDIAQFGQVLAGMADGNQALGVEPVTTPATAAKVAELSDLFSSLEKESTRVLDNAPELLQIQSDSRQIAEQGNALLDQANALQDYYSKASGNTLQIAGLSLPLTNIWAYGFIVLALLLALLLIRTQSKDARLQLAESEQRKQGTETQNQRNQEAILRLLDELGDLAEGDLTVQASVTEDITGAIADSINYAIEALRDLVSTINVTSEQITAAAEDTRSVADRLARASEIQARQIESSSSTVMQMAQSMDDVSGKSASSAEVAENSVNLAHEGGDRVRRTIQGMDAIREHIQETSKRIKRLGESSQEIGDIVALINDIADQTNILALNAAIQASAAGEAGRGFAVVADEVQRLAERSGNATKRIEALVKTIQADTNEAIISMEKSTTEVVSGADLAEKAGEALEEIETVSARLAGLIGEISKSSGQVTEMASRVSTAMTAINEITGQTSESSVATASSIGQLNQLARELRESVAGFRLPEQTLAGT